jgi:hypothetical protein
VVLRFLVVMWAAQALQIPRVQPERIVQSLERDDVIHIICCCDSVLLETFKTKRLPVYVGGA